MHAGSINSDLTAAGRVYKYLRERPERWIGGWQLTIETGTTAISTRISEVRHQLPKTEKIETNQEGQRFFYRWRRIRQPTGAKQLALGV
jgi:hypothetical protein